MSKARALALTGAAVMAMAATATPALAGTTMTQHGTFPAAGAVITCGALQLTPVTGTIDFVFHENLDGRGEYHYTGTDTARDVTLVDGSGASYVLHGTSSFSGTSHDSEGIDNVVTTSVDKFIVTQPGAGTVGMVSAVAHLSPNGTVTDMDLGTCEGTGGP